MEQTEILEGDKLIAKFMEVLYGTKEFPKHWYSNDLIDGHRAHSELKYHSSWDWLMPIIDKIESIDGCSFKVGLQFAFAYVQGISLHDEPFVVRAIGENRIGTAYNLVVRFIKWYNSLKS